MLLVIGDPVHIRDAQPVLYFSMSGIYVFIKYFCCRTSPNKRRLSLDLPAAKKACVNGPSNDSDEGNILYN